MGDESLDRPPPYMGSTFNHLCSLWVIVHEMVDGYYDGDKGESALARADLNFAQGIYQWLLAWADQLPVELPRSSPSPPHIVMAQEVARHQAFMPVLGWGKGFAWQAATVVA